jgi:glycine cleavage system H protein
MLISYIKHSLKLFRNFGVRYTVDHEWVNYDETTKIGVVGVTDYAQAQLGDIVHITLPNVSEKYKQKEVMATIESVKVVGDIYAPLSGTVLEVNSSTEKAPEIINQSAESLGWLIKLQLEDLSEISELMEKPAYDKLVQEILEKSH